MRAWVVSNEESRRTAFFIKAGADLGVDVRFSTYEELERNLSGYADALVKLEPPVSREAGFVAGSGQCREYIRLLSRLAVAAKGQSIRFLNHPEAIINTLDKATSKALLGELPVTPLLSSTITCFEGLKDLLSSERCSNVFIKPRYGSGAGGVMALRQNKRTGAIIVYTTLSLHDTYVYNTKRINRFTNPKDIALLADAVFREEALVERWIMKDTYKGGNYDLRIVAQFGSVDCIVVRCSRGAITNLHLNNKARPFEDLKLPDSLKEQINELSVKATALSGLQYAGIDILLERDSKSPYIIEVNGQGDHIYQDMYNGNRIYRRQLKIKN